MPLVSESQPLAREATAEFFSDSCDPTATEKIKQAAKKDPQPMPHIVVIRLIAGI